MSIIMVLAMIYSFLFRHMEAPLVDQSKSEVQTVRTAVNQPMATNHWFSNVYLDFPTKPLYSFPLAFKLTQKGLGISYPQVKKTQNTIFASYDEDITLEAADAFEKPVVKHYGDWNVNMQLKNGQEQWIIDLAHGIPYVLIQSSGKPITILFKKNPSIQKNSNMMIADYHEYKYVLKTDNGAITQVSGNTITAEKAKDLFIGLAHSDKLIDAYRDYNLSPIEDTTATPAINGSTVSQEFSLAKTDGSPAIVALFPHQYDNLESKPDVLDTFVTLRGTMQVLTTAHFTTAVPLFDPPESFEKLTDTDNALKNQIRSDTSELMKKGEPASRNYFLGVWFGKVANLIQLSQSVGDEENKKKLIGYVTPIFIDSLNYYSYDSSKKSLYATKPEFNNDKNNDHHFHYGYFIRLASILLKNGVDGKNITPTIEMMVNDIASFAKNSEKFPYLRHFDVYESHSWAAGYGAGDGLDQESTSEAVNAWYGVYLWSKVRNNNELEKYAKYLLSSEIQGAKYYWFNQTGIYSEPYSHKIAPLVFGGKVDFATWFSGDANMKYGIQILPLTPASEYLGQMRNIGDYKKDIETSGGGLTKPWGDLLLAWYSFYDKANAAKELSKVSSIQDGSTKSTLLYLLKRNSR